MKILKFVFLGLFLLALQQVSAQEKSKFHFYGGFGLGVSTDYFYVSLQPGVLYDVSHTYKMGLGGQYSYQKSNKSYYGVNYSYNIVGFNFLNLVYPYKHLEISGEFEDLYVMQNYNKIRANYWSPALFAGVGYRFGSVVAGFKYDFLHKDNHSVYQDAFVPYIRIYF